MRAQEKSLPTCKFSLHALNFFPNDAFTTHSTSASGNGLEEQLEQNKGGILASKTLLTSTMGRIELKEKNLQSALERESKIRRQRSLK